MYVCMHARMHVCLSACVLGPAAYVRPTYLLDVAGRGPVESRMRRAPTAIVVGRKGVGGFDQDLSKVSGRRKRGSRGVVTKRGRREWKKNIKRQCGIEGRG